MSTGIVSLKARFVGLGTMGAPMARRVLVDMHAGQERREVEMRYYIS
ncbi:hypothetical protein [Streptomyces sp. NPDC001978]